MTVLAFTVGLLTALVVFAFCIIAAQSKAINDLKKQLALLDAEHHTLDRKHDRLQVVVGQGLTGIAQRLDIATQRIDLIATHVPEAGTAKPH